jgi:hypothetical protein
LRPGDGAGHAGKATAEGSIGATSASGPWAPSAAPGGQPHAARPGGSRIEPSSSFVAFVAYEVASTLSVAPHHRL